MRYAILIIIGLISLIILTFYLKYQSCINDKNKIIEVNNQNEKLFNNKLDIIKKVKINTQKKIAKYYEANNDNVLNYDDDFLLQALSD